MATFRSHCRFVVAMGMLASAMLTAPVLMAQGVSPFGEATPATNEATPIATAPSGWEIVDIREIDVDGMPVALSPDGQWIAGTGPDREFCIWDIETLNPICAEPGDYRPHAEAIVWSPDSTAVAFTEDALRTFIDSDLYVFELGSGTLVNLTDDGFSGGMSIMGDESATVPLLDLGPAWMSDGQSLAFSRIHGIDRDGPMPEILQIDRAGGDPALLATLEVDMPSAMVAPMIALQDGRLVYSVDTARPDNPNNGIWMLAPGDEPVQIVSGTDRDEFPFSRLVDAVNSPDGVLISGISLSLFSTGRGQEPYAFVINAETGDVAMLEGGISPLRYGPDDVSTIAMNFEGDDGFLTITAPNGEVSFLGPVQRSRYQVDRGLDWATNNTVFLASGVSNDQLVTLAPVEA